MPQWVHRMVFDVESIGSRWGEDFSDEERAYLIEKAKRMVEREGVHEETAQEIAQSKLALSPLTGEVVLIGILNPDTRKGLISVRWPPNVPLPPAVFLAMRPPDELDPEEPRPIPIELDSIRAAFGDLDAAASTETMRFGVSVCPDEASLLRAFWWDRTHYQQVISFNGRGFDGPMVMGRSTKHGVRIPVGCDLVSNRYDRSHIDLADCLTEFGAGRDRYTLDFYCRRYGVPSPKADGMTGADVERLWRAGELARLCRYLAGDLIATAGLFEKYERSHGLIRHIPPIEAPETGE